MRLAKWAVVLMSLVALSAAPALAQDAVAIGGGNATGGNVQYVNCSQVQNAVQGQYGDATAIGNRAVAAIANEQNITQDQVNACLGDIGQNDDNNNNNDDDNNTTDDNTTDDNTTDDNTTDDDDTQARDDDVLADTIPKTAVLPDTGGPSPLALGAGLALVAGGTLMRFRR